MARLHRPVLASLHPTCWINRIDSLPGEIEAPARQDQACSRLMTVPGIGQIIVMAVTLLQEGHLSPVLRILRLGGCERENQQYEDSSSKPAH
jgi:hypothetical protein